MVSALRGRYRRIVLALFLAVIALAVLAVVLDYVYTSTSVASVTIEGGTIHIDEGQNGSGYWFGAPDLTLNGSADGYPLALHAGGTFEVAFTLTNQDTHNHTVASVSASGPFVLLAVEPPLPAVVPPGFDAYFHLTLRAPTTAGSYSFAVTVAATA
jgi:hypothetical protein